MRPLCRERLNRLLSVLDRHGGFLSIRQLTRMFSIWEFEVEQAAELGWVVIETRKPHTGRPSRIARKLSETQAAKLPPWRWGMEKPISYRHDCFALYSVTVAVKGGCRYFGVPGLVKAYQRAFPSARKLNAAAASCSRLLRRDGVRAAREWYYAKCNHEIPDEPMPQTVGEIRQRLMELGNWRYRRL